MAGNTEQILGRYMFIGIDITNECKCLFSYSFILWSGGFVSGCNYGVYNNLMEFIRCEAVQRRCEVKVGGTTEVHTM